MGKQSFPCFNYMKNKEKTTKSKKHVEKREKQKIKRAKGMKYQQNQIVYSFKNNFNSQDPFQKKKNLNSQDRWSKWPSIIIF